MTTFYFNTGVQPHNNPNLFGKQVWKGGTKQIPFDCKDVPAHSTFLFACDNPNMKELECNEIIVREIFNSDLCSKYAYFRLNN